MRQIESIELVLENCESIKIEREHIGTFRLNGIARRISRNAMNSISENQRAEELILQICSKANHAGAYSSMWSENDIPPFDRLMEHRDIVAVSARFKDGSEEYIYVPWGGDSDYTNDHQSHALHGKTGDLYIVVSEKEKAENYFSSLLSRENASFWEMYEGS